MVCNNPAEAGLFVLARLLFYLIGKFNLTQITVDSDFPMLHPPGDDQPQDHRQPADSNDNVTPEEWMQREMFHLAEEYAEMRGIQNNFFITFKMDDQAAFNARNAPVFESQEINADIAQFGQMMTNLRMQMSMALGVYGALMEKIQYGKLGEDSRDTMLHKAHAIRAMLTQLFQTMNFADVSVYEMMNLLPVVSQIDARRNKKQLPGNTIDLSTHTGSHSKDQHGPDSSGLDQSGEQPGPR